MLPIRPNVKTKTVILHRDGKNQPWGIRLVGGVDLGIPLVISRAQVGSPSEGLLLRGDVIKKLGDYDSRDLRHEDAQKLFQQAGNTITLVVQREQAQTFSTSSSRSNSVVPAVPSPLTMNHAPKGGVATPFALAAHSPKVSALAAPEFSAARASSPVVFPPPLPGEEGPEADLPTPSYHFQQLNAQVHPAYNPAAGTGAVPFARTPVPRPVSTLLSTPASTVARASSPVVFPPPRPDEVQELVYQSAPRPGHVLEYHTQFRATPIDALHDSLHDEQEIAAISNQPYRTTPLVLPGAKVKKEGAPTESYLRHHPNPLFRQAPAHFDTPADVLMKQKVADTVLQRVAAEEGGKQMVHKQFNSPIGLYSDQNITDSIQAHTGVQPVANVRAPTLNRKNQSRVSLKKTVSYDPAKSETFKALQEDQLGGEMTEVPTPAQTKVFSPREGTMTRGGGQKSQGAQPYYVKPPQQAQPNTFVNSLGGTDELIHQSGTFKRLMYQVLGEY